LKLNPVESAKFFKSVLRFQEEVTFTKDEKEETFQVEEETHFDIIANWEYYAVLNLIGLDNFINSHEHISNRLGIGTEKARKVIQTLIKVGLVKTSLVGDWERTEHNLRTSNGVSSDALIESHIQELKLAEQSLVNDPKEVRAFYSGTVKTNKKAYEKAVKLTYRFMHNLVRVLEVGDKHEVYQLGIQLFPLTKNIDSKCSKNTDVS
jgi:uncharacterized protein (TIGR02147 family)